MSTTKAPLIDNDGKIIGTGTLLNTNIRRVFVDPSYQHQGLGKIIMRNLEEKALEVGINILDLSSSLVSKRFYDSLGYITQTEDYIDVGNNQKLYYYTMIKN